jgi:antitoxin YefM
LFAASAEEYDSGMSTRELQLVSDEGGKVTAVVVPIEVWRDIASQIETNHLLKSAAMTRRVMEALQSSESIPLDAALARTGIARSEFE